MNHFEIDDLSQLESLNMLCGDLLGKGSTRTVFKNAFDAKLVVKVANCTAGIRANIEEFATWESVQFVKTINSWFAQCLSVSAYGSVLIQEYVPDVPIGKYKLPSFFTDLKPENYGLIVGLKKSQIVCRDYGLHLMREKGMKLTFVNFEVT
jgi:hypothetical protein